MQDQKKRRCALAAVRTTLMVFVALSTLPPSSIANAAYPDRPIRLIVPYAPGGAVDAVGRIMAQALSPRLGQQVVIDNRAGGGGIVGMDIAAHAPPDGYTMLVGSVGVASMPGLHKKLPFAPLRDFIVVDIRLTGTYLLGLNPSIQVRSVAELITAAKQNPGKLNFGSSGAGSTIHLAGEMLKSMARIDIVHVPYKSAGLAMTDVIAGNIQMMFAPFIVMLPMAKAGKVNAIAVTSAKRSELAPELPTVAESGLPGFLVSGWYGLLVPTGTPAAIVDRLRIDLRNGLGVDATKARLKSQGLEIVDLSPKESAGYLKDDIARWSRVIRDAGIAPE